jgi:hypothetical protein
MKTMTITAFIILTCLLLLSGGTNLFADDADDDATEHRIEPVVQDIEGWTVHVDPALLEGEYAEEGGNALRMLAGHLQRISILIPEPQLTDMRGLEIWIERHHELGSMQYHPSSGWLRRNGYDPRLAKKVHIPRAAALLSRQQLLKHPAVVLHELAHAYHDQCMEDGFRNAPIIDGYQAAKEAGIYEEVMLYTGATVRHYALTTPMEYFAEGTEAYLYRNDFYPFVGAELRQHDPELYDIMKETWGSPR